MSMDQTIPATWSPSPDCLASTDLWEWQKLTTAAYVLGGPVETSSCYPPAYTGVTSANYQATACPPGFSQACVDADLTTCCPTAYSLTCNLDTGFAYLDATTFPCTSNWPAEGLTTTITLTYTQLGSRAQSVASYTVTRASDSSTVTLTTSGWFTTTEVVSDGGTLYAMALVISPPATTTSTTSSTMESQSTTATSNNPISTQTGAGGLSSGAAAGVGVGVAVGVLIVAAAVFYFYRRRRVGQLSSVTTGQWPHDAGALQFQDIHRKPDLPQPIEMGVHERPGELPT